MLFAAGTTLSLELSASHGLELTSSDPAIIAVEPSSTGSFDLVSARAGRVTLTARCPGSDRVVATAHAAAAPVESITLHYRAAPGVNGPVEALAGLRGHADSILVRYISTTGAILPGRGPARVRDGTAVSVIGASPTRLSSGFLPHSTAVDLEFLAPGNAELVVAAAGIERVLPIEVVAAPATLELVAMMLDAGRLVPAPHPVPAGNAIGIDAVARTADGHYVSGVRVSWATTGGTIIGSDGPSSELVMIVGAGPTLVTGTATVGGLTATYELVAQ